MTTSTLATVLTIIRKDLQTELRSRELVNAMALFALLSILVFSFALELDRDTQEAAVTGILWVTLVFASILGLNRSLAGEREQGSLDGMLLSPIGRVAVYLGKMIGNFIFTLIVGLILIPLMSVLYNVNLLVPSMVGTVVLGTLGFAAVGTLLATMTVQTRSRETLLPIAMMPTSLPVLLLVVRASRGILAEDVDPSWLLTLLMIDIMYITLGSLLFEYVVED